MIKYFLLIFLPITLIADDLIVDQNSLSQYETDDYYAVTGFGDTIDKAAKKAVNFMIDYLVANYDISDEDAYMLCSLVGDLKIAEVVDVPNMLVTMHFPKSILTQL